MQRQFRPARRPRADPASKRAGRAADGHRPFVSEITDEQIVSYFNEMAPLSKTGILVYNAPGIGITLSPALLERLAEIPNVVGIKQGDLNPTAIDQIANRLRGRLRLFCASDLAFLGPMMAGFDGISTTNSGALPELIVNTFRAVERATPPPPAICISCGTRIGRWRANTVSRSW